MDQPQEEWNHVQKKGKIEASNDLKDGNLREKVVTGWETEWILSMGRRKRPRRGIGRT